MFYTYLLIDPRTGLPFYVGKGRQKRMYNHSPNHANAYMRARISEIKSLGLKLIYEKWFESDDEDFCYWMEIYLIDYFGRENLCNLTRGGEGILSGENHPSKDPKVREKIGAGNQKPKPAVSAAKKGVPQSQAHRDAIGAAHKGRKITWDLKGMRGKKHSLEARAKMGAAKLGKHLSPATEFQKGEHASPATEFKRGGIAPMQGKRHSEETRAKMRAAKRKVFTA